MLPPTDGFCASFNPKDFHVDLQTQFVTYLPGRPEALGFRIDFRFRDFDSDRISVSDFAAELMHPPASGQVPGYAELVRLSRIAATVFGLCYLARRRQRNQFIHQFDINEDATMPRDAYDQATNIFMDALCEVGEAQIGKKDMFYALVDFTAIVCLVGEGEPLLKAAISRMQERAEDFRQNNFQHCLTRRL